jgi:ABC-type transporter Mla maintaining outer membrane lipid asymmetry ATPase subunit MlaF
VSVAPAPVIELSGVSKDYRGLRPLRVEALTLNAGEQLAILGLDEVTAEVLINLVTGATLPDRGEVRVFGRPTSAIDVSADWLALVDRFGIVSHRAVLLDALTVVQNLSMPFTLDIEPPPEDVRVRAAGLAAEVGIPERAWARPVAQLDPGERVRLRLGRALALDPGILLLEHVSAGVARDQVAALGAEIGAIVKRRGSASLVATADEEFAGAVAARVLRLEPATGRLLERRAGFFGRLFGA